MINLGSSSSDKINPRNFNPLGTKITPQKLDLLKNIVDSFKDETSTIIAGVQLSPGQISFFCPDKNQELGNFLQELTDAHYINIVWYTGTVVR